MITLLCHCELCSSSSGDGIIHIMEYYFVGWVIISSFLALIWFRKRSYMYGYRAGIIYCPPTSAVSAGLRALGSEQAALLRYLIWLVHVVGARPLARAAVICVYNSLFILAPDTTSPMPAIAAPVNQDNAFITTTSREFLKL